MKRSLLCIAVLLLASGAVGQTTSTGNFIIDMKAPSFNSVQIDGNDGEMLVSISLDGTVTFGKHYKPDEAARIFWKSIGDAAPCPPAKQDKKAPPIARTEKVVPYWNSYNVVPISSAVTEPPPFDVPPKEWEGPEHDRMPCSSIPDPAIGCFDVLVARHHRTCADPKRVLLMSEDGKWHCYDFQRLGQD